MSRHLRITVGYSRMWINQTTLVALSFVILSPLWINCVCRTGSRSSSFSFKRIKIECAEQVVTCSQAKFPESCCSHRDWLYSALGRFIKNLFKQYLAPVVMLPVVKSNLSKKIESYLAFHTVKFKLLKPRKIKVLPRKEVYTNLWNI